MKPWQYGIELEKLKEIEQVYSEYNKYALGNPFMEFKKHQIANALHYGDLGNFFNKTYFFLKAVQVPSNITAYQDIMLGRKEKGDFVIGKLAGDLSLWESFLKGMNFANTWVYSWREDIEKHDCLINLGYMYCGPKISSFGDIMGIYFRSGITNSLEPIDPPWITYKHSILENISIERVWKGIKLDVDAIVKTLGDFVFTNHYSNYNDANAWSAISLRGYSMDWKFIAKPAEMNKKWKEKNLGWESWDLQDTPLRELFPEVEKLIQKYFKDNEIHRIRFMKLSPQGGELQRHTDLVDPDVGATPRKLGRFHFPIVTNPDMEFNSWNWNAQKLKVHMKVGECWYLDTRKPHRAINNGTTDRIHLVVDVVLTPKLIRMIENARQD